MFPARALCLPIIRARNAQSRERANGVKHIHKILLYTFNQKYIFEISYIYTLKNWEKERQLSEISIIYIYIQFVTTDNKWYKEHPNQTQHIVFINTRGDRRSEAAKVDKFVDEYLSNNLVQSFGQC